jgi:hypothetical protein
VSRAFQPCRCGDSRGWAGVPGTSCGMSAGCVIAFAANTGKCLARSPSAVGVVGVCQSLAGHERADDAVRPRGSDTGPGGSRMAEIRSMLGPDATRTRKPRRLHRRAHRRAPRCRDRPDAQPGDPFGGRALDADSAAMWRNLELWCCTCDDNALT